MSLRADLTSSPPRLGLGTAQFGMEYGISNRAGRPGVAEVRAILARAEEAGIGILDTAPAYGDSEAVLGEAGAGNRAFRIVTKTLPVAAATVTDGDAALLAETVHRSSRRLGVARLDAVLVHHGRDLAKPGGTRLAAALAGLKEAGTVTKVGASVYDAAELEAVLSVFTPDIVQLPVNVLDQRLIRSGDLARLKDLGVEIHARSAFLQGLLLMEPQNVAQYFAPIRPALEELRGHWRELGMGPVAGCLSFLLCRPEIDSVLVGVNSLTELEEILTAASVEADAAFVRPLCDDPDFLNPSRWPAHDRT